MTGQSVLGDGLFDQLAEELDEVGRRFGFGTVRVPSGEWHDELTEIFLVLGTLRKVDGAALFRSA